MRRLLGKGNLGERLNLLFASVVLSPPSVGLDTKSDGDIDVDPVLSKRSLTWKISCESGDRTDLVA